MSWLHHGIDNALGRGFPQENLHATEKTYENMLLVHWEIVFLAPVWILKKDPGDLLSMPIRMGGNHI